MKQMDMKHQCDTELTIGRLMHYIIAGFVTNNKLIVRIA